MKFKIVLITAFVVVLGGCARRAETLNLSSMNPSLNEPLPKINDPANLVLKENALSRWLVLYKKTTKG